MKTTHTLR